MDILVLNGSPRADGNTAAMVNAFVEGAAENGHKITVVDGQEDFPNLWELPLYIKILIQLRELF